MGNFWHKFLEWQNYLHYLLLTGGLIIWSLYITPMITSTVMTGLVDYIKLFFTYVLGVFLIDSFIHAVFWFLPEPWQWRD